MHQTAIKPQTKLETLRSIYTLVFQKRLTTTKLTWISILILMLPDLQYLNILSHGIIEKEYITL